MSLYHHVPVMLPEVLDFLAVKSGGKYIDCTLGGAGYTLEIAKRCKIDGRLLSLDMDEAAINNAKEKIKQSGLENITLRQSNFKNIIHQAKEVFGDKTKVNGIVMDLGLSSFQLEDENRGFSFRHLGPLDMSFGPEAYQSTVDIVNHYPLLELTKIFREYGEERRAYQFAKAIVSAREKKPLETTEELATLIANLVPAKFRTKIHPATRIFQALRIETNDELGNLRSVLPDITKLLAPGGKLVIVSFHSGEDRIVKWFLKDNPDYQVLTKRPLVPSVEEVANNPKSRSAKLRAAQRN